MWLARRNMGFWNEVQSRWYFVTWAKFERKMIGSVFCLSAISTDTSREDQDAKPHKKATASA